MDERRESPRYKLLTPIEVRSSSQKRVEGTTRDVSTSGLYFLADQPLEEGTAVEFVLQLPITVHPGGKAFIKAHGRVVRRETIQDNGLRQVGIAVKTERHDVILTESVADSAGRPS